MFIEKEEQKIDLYEYETGIPYSTDSVFNESMNTAIGHNSLYANTTGSYSLESDQIGIGSILVTNYVTNPSLVIKSRYGQTANLQEWRNSAGSVISGVDSEGRIFKYDSKGNKIFV